ncbi:MAG: antibiotic biosynthesis monooxygenase [Parachlamydiales bacterium]|jgi:hypothetical protein
MSDPSAQSSLTTMLALLPGHYSAFSDWQAKLRSRISAAPGFVSLEIFAPSSQNQTEWVLKQRFNTQSNLMQWRHSPVFSSLMQELKSSKLIENFKETTEDKGANIPSSVTEVYVTLVHKDKVASYQEWLGKVHQIESKFPGFQKVYVQAPENQESGSWITLLQFDNSENLERWLNSKERSALIEESKKFITSHESRRLYYSFDGWFTDGLAKIPPKWKQGMLVLLVLFPTVMMQYKYLAPHLTALNPALSTFLGNVAVVTLLTWPLMPFAIFSLKWWLIPKRSLLHDLLGAGFVLLLYALEIFLLWTFRS